MHTYTLLLLWGGKVLKYLKSRDDCYLQSLNEETDEILLLLLGTVSRDNEYKFVL